MAPRPSPLSISVNRSTVVRQTHTVKIDKTKLIQLLQPALDFGDTPTDAISITVRVPGGGDWSNTDLDIAEHLIEIEWTHTEAHND